MANVVTRWFPMTEPGSPIRNEWHAPVFDGAQLLDCGGQLAIVMRDRDGSRRVARFTIAEIEAMANGK